MQIGVPPSSLQSSALKAAGPKQLQVFSLHENFHTSELRDAPAGHVTERSQKEESGKVPPLV